MARFTQGGSSNNGGAELNYVQVVGTQQTISSAPNAIVDLNITTTGKPVQISVTGEGNNASAGSWVRVNLFRNNTAIGNAIQLESSSANENVPFAINFIDDVAAGTYNYSARVTLIAGGNWTFGEAAGPVINAVELTGFKGDRGLRGLTGNPGADGADALWNFTGEYSGGASYAVGDLATYDGQLWYRANANGGNVGDTPSQGYIWNLLAAKGADGADGADGTDGSGGLVFLGNYILGNGYVADLAVVRGSDNNLYIAKSSGGLADPVGNTAEWDIFSDNSTTGGANLVVPTAIKDNNGDDLITFEITNMGTARIGTPQDDLSLRSARDITLFAGDDGPGNVYIGWGDAVYTPDSPNRVATIGDLPEEFTLQPYGRISGDSDPAGVDRVDTFSNTFSEGPIDGIPVAANNNNALFVPINNEAFEDLISYQMDSQLSELSVTLNDQTVLSVDGFAEGVYIVNEQELPAGIVVLYDYITKTAEEIYPFVLTGTRTYPGVTNSITISVNRDVEGPETDWVFDSDGNLITPVGSPRIVNPAVPGNITLSAYSGVELSFADVPGAGLVFPDQSIQTTAYTGGAGADTGDITFVESTISNDTGDDIVIENKNDDGIVKARITLDQGNEQVLIEAIASDSEWFNNTQWSTAVWSGSVVTITNSPDIINFFNNAPGNVNRVSINDGGLLTYEGAGYGPSNITINVGGTPPEGQDPLTVTEIRFYYELVSEINIDHDDSEFNIISRGMSMTIDSSGELDLKARDQDLHLYANDDVRFTTNWDSNGTEYSWRMSESGKFELPGDGYIENPVNSSGDGSNYDTIKIVPDSGLIEQQYHEDQYLIIDPTQPNHIHIRAGGVQDASTADLFLGAERTGIKVSDSTGDVTIKSKNPDTTNIYENGGGFEPTVLAIVGDLSYIQPDANFSVDVDGTLYQIDAVNYNSGTNVTQITATPATFVTGMSYMIHESNGENSWTFTDNGYINGPAMGSLLVSGILNANGDLYIGSSDDNVSVSSGASINLNANNAVRVTTDGGDSAWDFSIDGKLYGPGEDGALVLGGELVTEDVNMSIKSNGQSVVLNGTLGEFLGSSDDANSQIATIGDVVEAQGTGANGEVIRWTPNFTATGLIFTGTDSTHPTYNSHYVKNGRMVSFFIEIDMATVTNFGTGQYKTELPFAPLTGTMNHFQSWCLVDETANPDNAGHAILQADHLANTSVLDLHYIKQSGGANSPVMEAIFKQGSPVTLTTATHVYINGTYITAE